jgi:hypothetical protein
MNNASDTGGHNTTTSVQVRGVLTTAPKTTYSYAPVDGGWVEVEWNGGVVREQIRIVDRGRGVPHYYWGHTDPTISSERLPHRLWWSVVGCLQDLNARIGAFEATIEVAGLEPAALAAAA